MHNPYINIHKMNLWYYLNTYEILQKIEVEETTTPDPTNTPEQTDTPIPSKDTDSDSADNNSIYYV